MDKDEQQETKTRTTIQIHKDTRELLGQIGRKGQTYDELIMDLIEARSKLLYMEMKIKEKEEEEEDK